MVWLIIFHSIFFSLEYLDNKIQALRISESLSIQMFSNGTVSVDTYFFLSGFLLAYTYLKNKIDKEQINPIKDKINKYFVNIMKRYIRAACNILVLFGLYKKQISVLSAAIYVALSRTVWAIGIAWIVIMCFTEHGEKDGTTALGNHEIKSQILTGVFKQVVMEENNRLLFIQDVMLSNDAVHIKWRGSARTKKSRGGCFVLHYINPLTSLYKLVLSQWSNLADQI
ncbi:hypothetical protein G5I_07167 [Acromyrmex echinatior]|uniref:Uncharacterized protein n=1 Tax=Acromyrmex echinatior TaxID=103372 RepID=F4WN21_ACREC|nr:hypothetical protein G5I_07167 [Acromyrmex echinatior]